jgi:hypothetical protein
MKVSKDIRMAARFALVALPAWAIACGGSSSNASSGTSNGGSSGTGNAGTTGTTSGGGGDAAAGGGGGCANPTVQIDFTPMYSAFIPGATDHTFQIPAVTDDGNPATWTSSDPSQVALVTQSFGTDPALPGVMITVMGVGTGTTGQVTIYATESDGSCGASVLSITTNSENDWQIGNARYNDGVNLTLNGAGGGGMMFRGMEGGAPAPRTEDGGSFYERDGGTACTNCHGPTATSGPYRDVSHTPEQTGGFSDDQLVAIFTQGIIPDGGYFDPTVLISTCDGGAACTAAAFNLWHSFHQWSDIQSDQYKGVVVYLRSLTPAAQNGTAAASNFGGVGRGRPDGGARGGRRDAGAPMMMMSDDGGM